MDVLVMGTYVMEKGPHTGDITGLGTVRLLEAIRRSGVPCRLYQASRSLSEHER